MKQLNGHDFVCVSLLIPVQALTKITTFYSSQCTLFPLLMHRTLVHAVYNPKLTGYLFFQGFVQDFFVLLVNVYIDYVSAQI